MIESFSQLDPNQQGVVVFSMLYDVLCSMSRQGRKDADEMILFFAKGGTIKELVENDGVPS